MKKATAKEKDAMYKRMETAVIQASKAMNVLKAQVAELTEEKQSLLNRIKELEAKLESQQSKNGNAVKTSLTVNDFESDEESLPELHNR